MSVVMSIVLRFKEKLKGKEATALNAAGGAGIGLYLLFTQEALRNNFLFTSQFYFPTALPCFLGNMLFVAAFACVAGCLGALLDRHFNPNYPKNS